MMNPEIFREYDIRGLEEKDLTDSVVKTIGQGYGTYISGMGVQELVVGRDGRLSSSRLRDALIEGVTSTGCNVIDLGVCPTPVFYFALHHLDVSGGMMITGSHNPPEFNGFKLCVDKTTIYGEEIQKFKRLIEKGAFISGTGTLSFYDIIPAYQQYIERCIGDIGGIKVVVDAGNGTAGVVAPTLLADMGCEVIPMYCELDGRFPHHHPDPTIPENLLDLIEKVRQTHAHLGIGYDGDADRLGIVDENGTIIWGDNLLIIFARDILREHPGATIISEVKCSMNLYREIEQLGGRGIMWKAGHSLIKGKMKEEGALVAGEMSGHMFFADRYFGYDDAIYATCRLIEIVKKTKKNVSELLDGVPKTFVTPEIRFECPEHKKFRVVETIKADFSQKYKIIDVDGVRVLFDDGWGLIRASNTQPALVIRFEATTQKRLEEIKELFEGELAKVVHE
ncbi:MAG: phosphomannomutase/phosphoglucomutase [Thermodesulfobacteriota bacterium]|nr:phosphomannomutase/phosphoglucomutase [Thermodesulfobacteriota bacterium]